MPFAGNEIEVTTPFITFSFNLPSFTKKRTQQSDVPLAADTYNCGIGQPVPLNTPEFPAPEFASRCGMALDPLERYEVELERIESRKLQEAQAVQSLIRQERERWEAREASKQLKRGHRRGSSASDIVRKFIHKRVDSGIAFTEEKEEALQVEEVVEAEDVIEDPEGVGEAPHTSKERVGIFKKIFKFVGW